MLQDDVLLSVFVTQRLVDGVVFLCQVLRIRSLPSVAPSAMQTAHLVGVGTRQKNLLSFCQRQDVAFVLQQHLTLLGGMKRLLGKLVTSEFLIAFATGVGFLEQP